MSENFRIKQSKMLNKTSSCGKWGLTPDQNDFQEEHGWWVQGLGSVMVGCFGFIMNSITLYVLTRQKLKKIFFNKLLTCLAIFDTLFIINGIYESYRLNMTKTDYCSMQGYVMLVLYPFRQIVLCCSIYMTIMLAFERYLAVSKPITYRRQSITESENKRLLKHLLPVIIVSVIYTVPSFLSFTIRSFPIPGKDFAISGNDSNTQSSNNSSSGNDVLEFIYCIQPTELRVSKLFVLCYVNITKFVVTGAIPIICLVILNLRIFIIIRASLKNRERLNISIKGANRHDANCKRRKRAEEVRQAMVLFGVVIVFFMCHILRIILDLEELISYEDLNETIEKAQNNGEVCEGVQFWTMITTDISHFLIIVNASINFFIYCFLSKQFRGALKAELTKLVKLLGYDNTNFKKTAVINKTKESRNFTSKMTESTDGLDFERNDTNGRKDSSGWETEEEILEIKELGQRKQDF